MNLIIVTIWLVALESPWGGEKNVQPENNNDVWKWQGSLKMNVILGHVDTSNYKMKHERQGEQTLLKERSLSLINWMGSVE